MRDENQRGSIAFYRKPCGSRHVTAHDGDGWAKLTQLTLLKLLFAPHRPFLTTQYFNHHFFLTMSSREPMWYCHEVSFTLHLTLLSLILSKCRSEMRPLMVRRTFPHSKTYRAEKSTILSRSLIPIVHRVIAHLWRRYVTCYLPLYLIHSLFTDRGRTRRPT